MESRVLATYSWVNLMGASLTFPRVIVRALKTQKKGFLLDDTLHVSNIRPMTYFSSTLTRSVRMKDKLRAIG